MQVVVDDVEAHVAGPRDPADRVQVGAVVVEERARVVEDPRDLDDPLVEQPERRRVGQHQPGGALVDLRAQVVEVEVAARVGLDLLELVARHRHARRVRAVRGVGGDDRVALVALAAVVEVGAHQHQPGQLALRAGGRLERDGGQAGDLGEDLLQVPHQLERALGALVLLVRMEVAEAGQRDDALVDARVVLHRAGAERVEAGVDPEVAVGERGEVAHELGLGDLGQARRRRPAQMLRDLGPRQVVAAAGARRGGRPGTARRSASPARAPRRAARCRPASASRSARRAARRPSPRSRDRAGSPGGRRARGTRGSRPAAGRPTRTANSLNVV